MNVARTQRLTLFTSLMLTLSLAMDAMAQPIRDVLPDKRPAIGEFLGDVFTGLVFAVTHPTAVRNTLANTVVDLLDVSAPGKLVFQTTGDVEVATLTFSNPAFGAASAGIATANSITDDSSATGGSTDRFDAEDGAGGDVFYGSVGVTGADINLSSVAIGAGDTVSVTSLTYAAPA